MMTLPTSADQALATLLSTLRQQGYRFITPTPETHRRVVARPSMQVAQDLRGIFGWNLPFSPELLPAELFAALDAAGLVEHGAGLPRSRVRVASVGDTLFVHSAYPTDDPDSVFFGPDSYRFVDFLRAELPRCGRVQRLVDIGAGSGVGGIMAAALLPGARITLTDINPAALRLAAINAQQAGLTVELLEAKSIDEVGGLVDLAISNPPYVMDEGSRTYRDGGDMHGARLSLDWTIAAARKLERGGRVLLYTGVAIVAGRDELREELEAQLPALGCTLRYREIDPDVFGEELEKPPYAGVERIAVVGAVVEKG